MRAKELKLMSEPDLENKMAELRKELMKLNSQTAIGTAPKNTIKIRVIKRTIARIITIKKQKGGNKKE